MNELTHHELRAVRRAVDQQIGRLRDRSTSADNAAEQELLIIAAAKLSELAQEGARKLGLTSLLNPIAHYEPHDD